MSKNRDDPLRDYRRKRDFTRTREPAGGARSQTGGRRRRTASTRAQPLRFVIQKHRATTLHFDLRLECNGVMKSWAVPKGLSLDPAHKRRDLPPTIADAFGLLAGIPEPTLTVHSGHGGYAFWCFKEPWIFETDEERARAADMVARLQVTAQIRAKARGWHVDSTMSLDHLLRPVGSINRKTAPAPVRSL